MEFDGPIPGESLTSAPKQYPWERPPETSDPREALSIHMDRLDDPEVMDGVLTFLEAGATIQELTMGMLRTAVSKGIHSPDVSLLIAPLIHEKVKMVADKLGIEADEGFEDKDATRGAEKIKAVVHAKKKLSKSDVLSKEEKKQIEEAHVEETVEEKPAKRGLMERSR